MTATPFRRDRQTLPGELVYHYPLSQAMEDEIYETIDFASFSPTNESSRDLDLCLYTAQKLGEKNAALSDDSKLSQIQALIRTNEIDRADELKLLYDEHTDLRVERVHSERTNNQNDETIEDLKDNELDGIIAVGKLGEGLDRDNLKLAVLHQPPKSFPFTLQLIGRVTRPVSDENISASVLADPEQMREQGIADTVRQLYREDQAWSELIPELVDEFVERHASGIELGRLLTGLRRADIEPSLSVTLYRVESGNFNSEHQIEISIVDKIFRVDTSSDDYVGWVSRDYEQPPWANNSSLLHRTYNLHLYYYNHRSETLFEYSSADRIASRIRSQIVNGEISQVSPRELASLLQIEQLDEFLNAGLRSGQGNAVALPNYKMYLGAQTEASVNLTDQETFQYGHALARLDTNPHDSDAITTRGVAIENGTVWASSRKPLDEFVNWCRNLARNLRSTTENDRIEGLGLRYPTNVDEFESQPYYLAPDPELYLYDVRIVDERESTDHDQETAYTDWTLLYQPAFEIDSWNDAASSLVNIRFRPTPESPPIEGMYDVSTDQWSGEIAEYTFRMDKRDGEGYVDRVGKGFLNEYPPEFYLGRGELVRAGNSFKFSNVPPRVPSEVFVSKDDFDWSGCDRRVEYRNGSEPENDHLTVHEWTENHVSDQEANDQIIFRDHSKGEIADYVVINQQETRISLYHCKSGATTSNGSELSIGASLGRVTDVLDQVLRSTLWVKNPNLGDQIHDRSSRDIEPDFINGSEEFEQFHNEFLPAEWNYRVIAVLPTLSTREAQETRRVNALFATCFEWLQQVDAEFRIIGDDGSQ